MQVIPSPLPGSGGTAQPGAWVIHCDGSALPNPGRMGLGAVLVSPQGVRTALSLQAPGTGCNNEAELRALLLALAEAHRQGAHAVAVVSDSRVLLEQLTAPASGTAAVPPIARLAPLFEEARRALAHFAAVHWTWVPRHRNAEADALARAAVGLAPKPHARPASAGGSKRKKKRPQKKPEA
ncbi:reverse transcriptase-like protein [Acidovorax sp. RAC01]|uniref:reverse transcriptase-like protein n=1 Tax=Acidovorax sp. RAC01 TaxID=1842533 RepID=UPI00083E869B|nr:reverse transcriptase-like protein [Acidovorax sp. RAC01]AOG23172.1 RNase H family protein [Acidovorax sp. RAC01]